MPETAAARALVGRLTEDLSRDLRTAWERIVAEQEALALAWPTRTTTARQRRLVALERLVRELMTDARDVLTLTVPALIEDATAAGRAAALADMTDLLGAARIDPAVALRFAGDEVSDLLTATRHVEDTTKSVVRRLARERIGDAVLTGQTAVDAGRKLADDLAENGISAVTYKDGSTRTLADYADMVLRTRTAEVYQRAAFATMAAGGVEFVEILDNPSCGLRRHDDPQKANGLVMRLEDAAQYPLSHPRCIAPDSVVGYYGGATQLLRAWFDGHLMRLTWATAAGQHTTTVGPHHPVLTSNGWRAAGLVREGQQLLHDRWAPRAVTLGEGGGTEPHFEEVVTAQDHFAASRRRGTHVRVPATSDDLHGDGVFCQGEVDVVDVDLSLLDERDPSLTQEPRQDDLVWPYLRQGLSVGLSARQEDLAALRHAADGSVSGGGVRRALLGGLPGGRQAGGGGGVAHQPRTPQALAHAGGGQTHEGPDLGGGELLVDVQLDEGGQLDAADGHRYSWVPVLSVERVRHVGWVFDATTVAGAFTADGIVVRNCVRTTIPRVDVTAEDVPGREAFAPSTTAAQRLDQAAVEAEREAKVARRAAKAAKAAEDVPAQQRHETLARRLDAQAARDYRGSLDLRTGAVTSAAELRHIEKLERRAGAEAVSAAAERFARRAAAGVQPGQPDPT